MRALSLILCIMSVLINATYFAIVIFGDVLMTPVTFHVKYVMQLYTLLCLTVYVTVTIWVCDYKQSSQVA